MPAKTRPGNTRKLPKALARVAAEKAESKLARLAAQARADIALILRKRQEIAESFYDIGEALVRLKAPGVAAALGHKSFAVLCKVELSMSSAKAEQLVAIVTRVPRDEALRLGQERTLALLDLASATPEADSPATLAAAKVKLPSGAKLEVKSASARSLRDAAKEIRSARTAQPARKRGRTTTPEERAVAARLQAELHAAGLGHARVTAVATKPGAPADLRIERVPAVSLDLLHRAVGRARKP